MSDVPGELARVQGAFQQPTLTLLHQRAAPTIIAMFRSAFGRDTRSITTARLHDQVDTYLAELKLAGIRDVPTATGRELCQRWMHDQWMVRTLEADGSEAYSLTSHAQQALTLVKSMSRERGSLSEHRIATIVAAARRFNTDVNPDRAARVRILDSEIQRLAAERDRLLDGGDLPEVSADYLLEGYAELLQLIAGLPSEFARVEEAFAALRSSILASFRAEDRPAGEVIDDYLRRADALMTATPEGRAFEGAFALLRDDELLLQLRQDLGALLEHPMADHILQDTDRRDLKATVGVIRRGIDEVLSQRRRVTATLRDYIVNHDVAHDRELDSTLRQLDAALTTWMQTAGPRSSVPLPLLPERIAVTHLKERFHDTATDSAPPPLQDVTADRPPTTSLQELLRQGGPTMNVLRAALDEALVDPAIDSLGELFASLDPALRRPVEILGLLHLATNRDELTREDTNEIYAAVRPDGAVRRFAVPRLAAPANGTSVASAHRPEALPPPQRRPPETP